MQYGCLWDHAGGSHEPTWNSDPDAEKEWTVWTTSVAGWVTRLPPAAACRTWRGMYCPPPWCADRESARSQGVRTPVWTSSAVNIIIISASSRGCPQSHLHPCQRTSSAVASQQHASRLVIDTRGREPGERRHAEATCLRSAVPAEQSLIMIVVEEMLECARSTLVVIKYCFMSAYFSTCRCRVRTAKPRSARDGP